MGGNDAQLGGNDAQLGGNDALNGRDWRTTRSLL